jgi:hypothetical protein
MNELADRLGEPYREPGLHEIAHNIGIVGKAAHPPVDLGRRWVDSLNAPPVDIFPV